MALVAEPLARVRAGGKREGQLANGDQLLAATVKQAERGAVFFRRAIFAERGALAVNGVAGKTGDGGLESKVGLFELPWTLAVERRDQLADGAFKMHAMAAKAVVHQGAFGVVLFVEEDAGKGGCMRTSLPLGEFLAMTLAAAIHHGEHLGVREFGAFGRLPRQMGSHPPEVSGERAGVTFHAVDAAVGGVFPGFKQWSDFVAAGAAFAPGSRVVEIGRWHGEQRQQRNGGPTVPAFHVVIPAARFLSRNAAGAPRTSRRWP